MNCRAKYGEFIHKLSHKGLSKQIALKLILSRLGAKGIRLTTRAPEMVDFSVSRKPTALEIQLATEEAFPTSFYTSFTITEVDDNSYKNVIFDIIDVDKEDHEFVKKVKVFFGHDFQYCMKDISRGNSKTISSVFISLMKSYGHDTTRYANSSNYVYVFEGYDAKTIELLMKESGLINHVDKIMENSLGNLRFTTKYKRPSETFGYVMRI